jgi:FKBP-type peptidyl-prolyl cis-trans isomerase FkpA
MAAWVALVTLAGAPSCKAQADKPSPAPSPAAAAAAGTLTTEEDKTLYALGLALGLNITDFGLSPRDLEIVKRGLGDAASGAKQEVDIKVYGPKVRDLAMAKSKERAAAETAKAAVFIDQTMKEAGAVKTPSGMVFIEQRKGTGASPKASDTVKVHYKGTLVDGKVFDSSYDRGEPAQFPLNGVIPCWTEGVQKMAVGGKAKLVCPPAIAYGESGRPPVIPPAATLVFEVELLEVSAPPVAPPASKPAAPAASPAPKPSPKS